MKKFFYSMFALASMLLATGCSGEEEIVSSGSTETVKASFTLDLGEGVMSRAEIGDGLTATDLYCGVFDQKGNVIPGLHQQKTLTDRTATVEFTLVKGQTYDFVFWAQAPNNKHYEVDKNNLTTIKVNYNQPANAESRDAFLGKLLDHKVEGHFTKTIYLYRPFAQLNVGTTLDDYKKASELLSVNNTSKNVNKSNLIISKAYTTLNTLTSEVGGEAEDVQLTLEARPSQYLYVDIDKDEKDEPTPYEYLSLNYLLAKESSELFEVKVQLNSDDDVINTLEVQSVPLRRNYRTNIIGNLLTTTGEFTVIVDKEFLKPNYIVEPWNGEVKKVNDGNTYEISEAAELAWIAQQVNGGNNFAGKTILLKNDIDLNHYQWTPMGNNEKVFSGTLDGDGHIIKHLVVNSMDAPAGLIGWLDDGSIKNLTIEEAEVKGGSLAGVAVGKIHNTGLVENVHVKNAAVEGNHYVGGMVGYAYGSIKNSTSTNVTVVAKPEAESRAVVYRNGDKAGGILGFLPEDCNGEFSGNIATDVKVTAYRDLGGLVGAGNATNMKDNKVSGTVILTIDKSVTCYDENGNVEEAKNAEPILGRVLVGTLDSSNITSEATVTKETIEAPAPEGLVKVDDNNWEITNMEGLFEFAKTVNEDGVTYAGATVKLTADIALAKAAWTPIGLNADGEKKFKGTFDGQGHTITDLYVETEAGYTAAGFFGALNGTAKNFTIDGATVKHLSSGSATDNGIAVVAGSIYGSGTIEGVTVKNAVVEGNRYVGGISGYTYGNVKNCVVENITLTATPDKLTGSYDNGDKVGGIAGYFCDEISKDGSTYFEIVGNKVLNAKITGYRDLGGIVGCARNASFVKSNQVNTAIITVNQETNNYGNKDENAGAIVGRITVTSNLGADNVAFDVNVIIGTAKGLMNAIASGTTEITLSSGNYELPAIANKDVTIAGTKDVEITVKTPNLSGADLTLSGVTVKASGYATGVQHVNTVTYNDVTIVGEMCLYGEEVIFNNCTFELNNQYIWTYGAKKVKFNNCVFNTNGKAILVYNEGAGANDVEVSGCTFNATAGSKAGAIANQNCAAIEIDNFQSSGVGAAHKVTTSGNTYSDYFSGEWRIKNYVDGNAITVNNKKYTTLALDGKTMTIDANKNVTVNE